MENKEAFKAGLRRLQQKAESQGLRVTISDILACFPDRDLTRDQIRLIYEYAQEDWEELETKIDNLLEGDNLIISGSVGRWDGTNRGYETYPNWQKFIQDFGKDCDYFKVYTNNGHLYVKCSHHDGNNFCEVKRLTPLTRR